MYESKGKRRAPRVPVDTLEVRVRALEAQVTVLLNELAQLRQDVRDAARS